MFIRVTRLLIFSAALIFLGSFHALYVSVVEINKPSETEITVTIKVFTDDLQNAVRNYSDEYIPGALDSFIEPNRKLVERYFNDNFRLLINSKKYPIEFKKAVQENDAHFLYFSAANKDTWSEVQVQAPFFMELFPDQSNIIRITHGEKKYLSRITASSKTFTQKIAP